LELSIAIGILAHRAFLQRYSASVAMLNQQSRNHAFAGRCRHLTEPAGNLPTQQVRPFDILPHWVTDCVVVQVRQKILDQLRESCGQRFSPPFRRVASSGDLATAHSFVAGFAGIQICACRLNSCESSDGPVTASTGLA
jgi:hypothetical protein